MFDATATAVKEFLDENSMSEMTAQEVHKLVEDTKAKYPEIFSAGVTVTMMGMILSMTDKTLSKEHRADMVLLPVVFSIILMEKANDINVDIPKQVESTGNESR
jgi:hypothetical protein